MTHDHKVAASFLHQNVAVPITSYPCTKFHTDIIAPSSKTTLNLNLNLVRTDGRTDGQTDGRTDRRTDGRTDAQTEELYARPALQAGHKKKNTVSKLTKGYPPLP